MAESNVVNFTGITKLDLPVERVINDEVAAKLTDAVVIGWDKDGDFYFGGTYAAGPDVLWLLEIARRRLMEIGDR